MKDWDLYYKRLVRESDYRIIFLILDGMPDIYIKELEGTPLSAGSTPHLDQLAKDGASGLIFPTIEPHIPVGSGPAHFALLGYELNKYPGRGPLEALGAGLTVPQGSIVIRINFATIDENNNVIDRRAGRIDSAHALKLIDRLKKLKSEKFGFLDTEIHHTKGYRGILLLRGDKASADVTDSDPREVGKPILEVQPDSDDKTAQITANFLNWFVQAARKELSKDNLTDANAIVTRGVGAIKLYESFTDRYKFKKPIFISSYPLYKGVARFFRIDVAEPAMRGKTLSIKDKFQTAANLMKEHDITILHVKDPDIAGEDGDYLRKKAIIEEIDSCIPLITERMTSDDTLVITSDHSTPCAMKEHSGHPIPLLMKGPFVRVDSVEKFSELDCIHGSLGTFRAIELMNLILMSTKRLKTFWP